MSILGGIFVFQDMNVDIVQNGRHEKLIIVRIIGLHPFKIFMGFFQAVLIVGAHVSHATLDDGISSCRGSIYAYDFFRQGGALDKIQQGQCLEILHSNGIFHLMDPIDKFDKRISIITVKLKLMWLHGGQFERYNDLEKIVLVVGLCNVHPHYKHRRHNWCKFKRRHAPWMRVFAVVLCRRLQFPVFHLLWIKMHLTIIDASSLNIGNNFLNNYQLL